MTDPAERLAQLEGIIEQMLSPLRGIPFNIVVKSLSQCSVIPIDRSDPHDIELIEELSQIAVRCGLDVCAQPIVRPRPNEVGNDIEPFVKAALVGRGFRVEAPTSRGGRTKGVGYPDILFYDKYGRPTYLECKTFSLETLGSSMRSFYLSPSDEFKISLDARHLVISFEMEAEPISGSRNSKYCPVSYKVMDVYGMTCDVKYEFNSDNRRMYGKDLILTEGPIPRP